MIGGVGRARDRGRDREREKGANETVGQTERSKKGSLWWNIVLIKKSTVLVIAHLSC